MPTTFYFRNDACDIDATADVDKSFRLASAGSRTDKVTDTAAGGTYEEVTDTQGGTNISFVSGPLNPFNTGTSPTLDLTLYMWESDALANVRGWFRCFHLNRAGAVQDGGTPFIDWFMADAELSTTPDSFQTLTNSGFTANLQFNQGDRIQAVLIGTNAVSQTMAAGYTFTASYGVSTGVGATLVTFNTLTITEETVGLDYSKFPKSKLRRVAA